MEKPTVIPWGEVPLIRIPLYYPDALNRINAMLRVSDVNHVRDVLDFLKNHEHEAYIGGDVLRSVIYRRRGEYQDVTFTAVPRQEDEKRIQLVEMLKSGENEASDEFEFPRVTIGASRFLVGHYEFKENEIDYFRLVPLQGRLRRLFARRKSVVELHVLSIDNFNKLYQR